MSKSASTKSTATAKATTAIAPSPISSLRRIMNIFVSSEMAIRPHCIVTGPSGAGKTYTLELLAAELGIDMLSVNAASLTKEGTSGNSLSKALSPLAQFGGRPVIVMVDEFDKIFIAGNTNSALAHETTNGVQNEFLTALEGRTSVFADYGKYINIKTDNCLFVFAGAFNGEDNISLDRLREMGVKTEFLGRVGLVYGLEKVSLAVMQDILTNSPLLATYLELVPSVKKEVVVGRIMTVLTDNYDKNTIGVRMINTLLHQYFVEGGILPKAAEKLTFQRKLTLDMPEVDHE